MRLPGDLLSAAHLCLCEPDPARKVALTQEVARARRQGVLPLVRSVPCVPVHSPGRPVLPHLVAPRCLPRRSPHTRAGRTALIHALCHIEFNAINLAWDALYRFRDMPQAYYDDWLGVADEEAHHFSLLRAHLQGMGSDYGTLDAHDGLWAAVLETAHDVLIRMALVPRVLEARGLDVTPGIMEKLRHAGDVRAVEILRIIQRDEIGHVAIGSHWFRFLCLQRGLDPELYFRQLLASHFGARVRGPFDRAARRAAGFSEQELDYLETRG